MSLARNWYERKGYRLPTEAEWEAACRSGALTAQPYGHGTELLPRYAWYEKNAGGTPRQIGLALPNDWGLFDVLGNVSELTLDRLMDRTSSKKDPFRHPFADEIPNDERSSVTCGGCWYFGAGYCRSAGRQFFGYDERDGVCGMRLAQYVPNPEIANKQRTNDGPTEALRLASRGDYAGALQTLKEFWNTRPNYDYVTSKVRSIEDCLAGAIELRRGLELTKGKRPSDALDSFRAASKYLDTSMRSNFDYVLPKILLARTQNNIAMQTHDKRERSSLLFQVEIEMHRLLRLWQIEKPEVTQFRPDSHEIAQVNYLLGYAFFLDEQPQLATAEIERSLKAFRSKEAQRFQLQLVDRKPKSSVDERAIESLPELFDEFRLLASDLKNRVEPNAK